MTFEILNDDAYTKYTKIVFKEIESPKDFRMVITFGAWALLGKWHRYISFAAIPAFCVKIL